MDYSRINNQLGAGREEARNVEITIVSLGGVTPVTVSAGMTVGEFKERNNLVGQTVVDENTNILNNSDIIRNNMQVFVSAPKKNGNK